MRQIVKYCWLVSTALLLALLSFLVFPGVPLAHAAPPPHAIPQSASCTGTSCEAFFYWPNPVHGAQSQITLSNPGEACGLGDFYTRSLYLPNTGSGDSLEIGEIRCAFAANYDGCTKGTDNLQIYFIIRDATNNVLTSACNTGIQSTDINGLITYKVAYYVSNGGGVNVWATGQNSGIQYMNCTGLGFCTYAGGSNAETYASLDFLENIDGTFSGHHVWGSAWEGNQYLDMSGVWRYQGSDGTFISVPNPVQMYWNLPPSLSSTGGEMYSCVYDSGQSCIFGS